MGATTTTYKINNDIDTNTLSRRAALALATIGADAHDLISAWILAVATARAEAVAAAATEHLAPQSASSDGEEIQIVYLAPQAPQPPPTDDHVVVVVVAACEAAAADNGDSDSDGDDTLRRLIAPPVDAPDKR